ncbi:MAG: hypothetical protein ACR2QF_05755 [Geminicoccaceae bacterium]
MNSRVFFHLRSKMQPLFAGASIDELADVGVCKIDQPGRFFRQAVSLGELPPAGCEHGGVVVGCCVFGGDRVAFRVHVGFSAARVPKTEAEQNDYDFPKVVDAAIGDHVDRPAAANGG